MSVWQAYAAIGLGVPQWDSHDFFDEVARVVTVVAVMFVPPSQVLHGFCGLVCACLGPGYLGAGANSGITVVRGILPNYIVDGLAGWLVNPTQLDLRCGRCFAASLFIVGEFEFARLIAHALSVRLDWQRSSRCSPGLTRQGDGCWRAR